MKELIVISGKGGTGKTTLTAAFTFLAENRVLCDADVDAADLHLLMAPEIKERHSFKSGNTAVIISEKCTQCDRCRELCRFDAISENYQVDPVACEGCGVCVHFCPEEAIDFPLNTCGEWYISDTRFGPMVHASLGIAEENSGKLVTLVRKEARSLAEEKGHNLILTDGPPGVGCPVIAAIGGASGILIVTEPTVSGHHDMERVVELADYFKVPAMVMVNKFDLNLEMTERIKAYAEEKKLRYLGEIPFDPNFTRSMAQGKILFEFDGHSPAASAVTSIWKQVSENMAL